MLSLIKSSNSRSLLLTAAYYLSFIVLGLSTAVDGPSLPTLARHTHSALDQISLLFVFGSLGYFLGSLLGGWTYDRFPGHRFMSVLMVIIAAACTVIPVASTLWLLLLAAFIAGFSKGALDVGCNTLLQWVHGEKVGPFMNGLHFFFGVGSFLAPVLLAQAMRLTHEIHWAFWIISILALPVAVWLWLLPESPAPIHAAQKENVQVPFLPVVLIVTAFVLYVGSEVGFSSWIYTYAVKLNLADSISAAYLTSAFWGSFTLGRLLGIWISTRAKSRTILLMDFVGCFVSLGLILAGRGSAAMLWLGSILLGLSMASIFPTTLILAGESLRVTGTVTSWFLVGSSLGGMLLPWLIGQTFALIGPTAMMIIILIDLVFNGLALFFVASSRREPLPAAI